MRLDRVNGSIERPGLSLMGLIMWMVWINSLKPLGLNQSGGTGRPVLALTRPMIHSVRFPFLFVFGSGPDSWLATCLSCEQVASHAMGCLKKKFQSFWWRGGYARPFELVFALIFLLFNYLLAGIHVFLIWSMLRWLMVIIEHNIICNKLQLIK